MPSEISFIVIYLPVFPAYILYRMIMASSNYKEACFTSRSYELFRRGSGATCLENATLPVS